MFERFWTLASASTILFCLMALGCGQTAVQPQPNQPVTPMAIPAATPATPAATPAIPVEAAPATQPEAGMEPLPAPTDSTGMIAAPPADPALNRTKLPGASPALGATAATTPPPAAAPGTAPPVGLLAIIAKTPGKVLAAETHTDHGVVTYETLALSAAGILTRDRLYANGAAIPGKQKVKSDRKLIAAASVAKVGINRAIEIATQALPGKAEDAKLSTSKGYATWKIKVRTNVGQSVTTKIDAGTGRIITD